VRNHEFRGFVEAGGYDEEKFWYSEAFLGRKEYVGMGGKPGPGGWRDGNPPSGQDDFPVTEVTLHEARAFALFLGARLPTREEWMVSAGFDPIAKRMQAYPWGDTWLRENANLMPREGEGKLLLGGSHATDQSPLGVFDMAGNVAEWTVSPYPAAEGMVYVKGGSYRHSLAATIRIDYEKGKAHPSMRWPMLGFRLVVDPDRVEFFSRRLAKLNRKKDAGEDTPDGEDSEDKGASGSDEEGGE